MRFSERWQSIRDSVVADDVKVVSFDLFRTVLDRPCCTDAMLRLLAAEADMDLKEFTDRRNACGGWWALRDMDSHILKQKEMAMECRFIQMRESVLALSEAAKGAGKTVIVITDNYIPSELLTKALSNTRFRFDRVFSSADTGNSKEDGSLFSVVIDSLRESMPDLVPADIFHIGDNHVSDVVNAQAHGIRAMHYPAASDLFRENFLFGAMSPSTVGDELLEGYVAGSMFDDPFSCGTDAINGDPRFIGLLVFPLVFGACAELTEGDSARMAEIFLDIRAHADEILDVCSRYVPTDGTAVRMLGYTFADDAAADTLSFMCSGFLRIVSEDLPHLRFSMSMYADALQRAADQCPRDTLVSRLL